MKILLDSMSRRFGDTLTALPFTSLFREKFGKDVHITFGSSPYESDIEFYRHISTIDDVVLGTLYNPSGRGYDMSFDIILRTSFDVDVKFSPHKIFGELDTKEGWDICMKNYPIKFLYYNKSHKFPKTKKRIGLFVNFPRKDISIPVEIGVYPVNLWQQLINILNKKYHVYVFTGMMEPDYNFDNCHNLGKLKACDELSVTSNMDIVIGTSCGFMDMVATFADIPKIVLSSCEEDETCVWSGIPDKCTLPQNRYNYFISPRDDMYSFIKPSKGARLVEWYYQHLLKKMPLIRNMRSLSGIDPLIISEHIDYLLSGGKSVEWFVEGHVCDTCKLKKDFNQCSYVYKPSLKDGSYYKGNWDGYNTR